MRSQDQDPGCTEEPRAALTVVIHLGDAVVCADCGTHGVVVGISPEVYDPSICPDGKRPLEVSGYAPGGVTCIDCERARFKKALPQRGVCANCGKANYVAILRDLGATQSFCNSDCINEFITRNQSAT